LENQVFFTLDFGVLACQNRPFISPTERATGVENLPSATVRAEHQNRPVRKVATIPNTTPEISIIVLYNKKK
jgi:hypothetical protein